MGTYIMLASWTEQGIRTVKESPARLDAAKQAVKSIGGEIKSFYMTIGKHDFVVVYEAPDDAAAARFTLALAKGGNWRSQTLKAFTEAEYRDIVASLG
jgi:uncharacterized protein with GYD domain